MASPDGTAVKSKVQAVEVTYFVHATEDPEKLRKAVADLLGLSSGPAVEELAGHFGNAILSVKFHAVGHEAESAVERVFASMTKKLRGEIASDLGAHLDDHSALFLRFDKQLLVQGKLALGSGDPVRVKVKPRLFQMRSGAPEFYRGLMEGGRAA